LTVFFEESSQFPGAQRAMKEPTGLPLLALVTALAVGLATSAHGELLIGLDDGTTTLTVADGAANDQCVAVGCVGFGGSVGNFNVQVISGSGYPAAGSTNSPSLDLNAASVSTGGTGGTLRIFLTQTDFVSFAPLNLAGSIAGTQSGLGTVATQFFMDFANTPFGEMHQIGTTLTSTDPIFNGLTSGLFNPAEWYRQFGWGMYTDGAFSLTEEVDLTMGAYSNASFDASFADPPGPEGTPVPEPSSLVVLGSALVGICVISRRRANAPAQS
jgi:hypothetical protein